MSLASKASSLVSAAITAVYFSPLRSVLRAIFRLLTPGRDIELSFPGYKVFVRTPDRLIAALLCRYSFSSGLEACLYRQRVKPGMTVLEIGANVGFFTPLFSSLAGETGRVYAFEPDPENFRLLQKNVAANGLKNVTCVMKAVSDKSGAATLFFSEEHRGDHRIFESGPGRKELEIETVSLDSFLPEGTLVDFVKMDIQGAEYRAFTGMTATIRRSPALLVLCEFSPSLLRAAGDSPQKLLEFFSAAGLRASLLDEAAREVRSATADGIMNRCGGDRYVNLLLEREAVAPGGAGN